jgi:hypothetical protein
VVNDGVQSAAGTITLTADDDLTISADVMTTAGNGAIDLNAGTDLVIDNDAIVSTVGNGAITGDAVRSIELEGNVGTTTVETVDGSITFVANNTGVAGDFHGIELKMARIETANGAISLTGQGGDNTGGSPSDDNDGIYLDGSTIESTGTGTITLDGTATAGANSDGIDLDNDVTTVASTITSVNGAILITALSTGADNGFELQGGSTVVSTGTGASAATITINGTAELNGVSISNTGSAIRSIDGAIRITGTGTGAVVDGTYGLQLSDGEISSIGTGTNAATITLTGMAFDDGLDIDDAFSVNSVDGNILIEGTSDTDDGIDLDGNAVIRSTGTGANAATITFNGTGNNSKGIESDDSQITSVDGNISLTGNGNEGIDLDDVNVSSTGSSNIELIGVGNSRDGIDLGTTTISSMGTGTITLDGTTNATFGFFIDGATTQVSSVAGDISITGSTTAISIDEAQGVDIASGIDLVINATNAANITITGTGDAAGEAVVINSPISSETGFVTIRSEDGGSTTDDILFGADGDITSISGTITIDADNAGNTADVTMADGAVIDAGSSDQCHRRSHHRRR